MNPLAVSFAWALNGLALFILIKYMLLWLVAVLRPGPAQSGLAAYL